jgi:predicted amidohydrolase
VKVAAYQMAIDQTVAIEPALEAIAAQVRVCEQAEIDILCCPEAVLGGLADYSDNPSTIALTIAELERRLAPIASDTVTTIIGFTEAGLGGALFNSAAVLSNGSIAGVYRKHHPAINRSVYAAGTDTPVFETGEVTFGIVICLDSRFSDPMATLVSNGARVIFIPTNNGMPEEKGGAEMPAEARALDIARAKEHGVLIVRADVAGRSGDLVSYGSSSIVSPGGLVMASGDALTEGLIGASF